MHADCLHWLMPTGLLFQNSNLGIMEYRPVVGTCGHHSHSKVCHLSSCFFVLAETTHPIPTPFSLTFIYTHWPNIGQSLVIYLECSTRAYIEILTIMCYFTALKPYFKRFCWDISNIFYGVHLTYPSNTSKA